MYHVGISKEFLPILVVLYWYFKDSKLYLTPRFLLETSMKKGGFLVLINRFVYYFLEFRILLIIQFWNFFGNKFNSNKKGFLLIL